MKTDINGVSQCQKGTENYETFYTTIRRKRTKLIQYDYRNEDGELFTCVKPTLTELLDGNDIGLMCRVESRHDQYYKYCKVIKEGENDINRGTTGNVER